VSRAKTFPVFVLAALVSTLGMAVAGEPEARDVARQSNCSPNKITALREVPGETGTTVYQVTCDGKAKNTILIECQSTECVLLK
jgi:hypothetical protein